MLKTQYGFQKARSTQHAIHIIRRILEVGESTTNKLLLVLLDWKKNIGQANQGRIVHSTEKSQHTGKIVRVIAALYDTPTFIVEIDGVKS